MLSLSISCFIRQLEGGGEFSAQFCVCLSIYLSICLSSLSGDGQTRELYLAEKELASVKYNRIEGISLFRDGTITMARRH